MEIIHILPTKTGEHREHVLSKDCWCNPIVIPTGYDWDGAPGDLVKKALEENKEIIDNKVTN